MLPEPPGHARYPSARKGLAAMMQPVIAGRLRAIKPTTVVDTRQGRERASP